MIIRLPEVIVQPSVRSLCLHPYSGHPHGCPNYNHKLGCPPGATLFTDYFRMDQPIYAIIIEFDLAHWVKIMKQKHPHWSYRQLSCCLYWQTRARKSLEDEVIRFRLSTNRAYEYDITRVPEADGVNVTETLAKVGVILEWPPTKIVRLVAIAGIPE